MAQQAAFAQIPDAVKRVRIALDPDGTTSPLTYMYLILSSSSFTFIKPFWRTILQR
jgi:hypothetical protein